MKYKVEKIKQAQHEYESLTTEQKQLLDGDYALIENKGLKESQLKK